MPLIEVTVHPTTSSKRQIKRSSSERVCWRLLQMHLSAVIVHSSSYYSRLRSMRLGARHVGCVEKASDRHSAPDAGARMRTSGSAAVKVAEEQLNPELQKPVLSPGCPAKQTKTSILIYVAWGVSTFQWCSVVDSIEPLITPWHCVFQSHRTRSWLGDTNGRNFDHGLRLRTGIVLHIGTW